MNARYNDVGSIIWTGPDGKVWTVPSLDSPTSIAQQVRDWVAAGNTIAPYAPPPPPPVTTVTPRQARLALNAAGLLTSVQALIDAGDAATKITWEYAIEFRREDQLINGLGAQLGLTAQQIDDLFALASTL